jgi:hypothetical protein
MEIFGKKTIVDVYAPKIYINRKKGAFWETFNEVLEKISNKSELFLMSDLDARVAKEERDQVVGRFGKEEINSNGRRLREACD